MRLLVSDANILIDMEEGQLLTVVFKLPFELIIPDLLFSDELEELHPHWLGLGLKLGVLSGVLGMCQSLRENTLNQVVMTVWLSL